MRFLLALFAICGTATALTPQDLNLLDQYRRRYLKGQCEGLEVRDTAEGTSSVYLELRASGIPNHATFKTNSYSVKTQRFGYYLLRNPDLPSPSTQCVPHNQPIGFAINGVPFYSPLAENYENAVQGNNSRMLDGCHGYLNSEGVYLYYEMPALDCLFPEGRSERHLLVGVAIDGYAIYYLNDTSGQETLNLDACHGTRLPNGEYRYYITREFPYIIGCFRGRVGRAIGGAPLDTPSCRQSDLVAGNGGAALCSCQQAVISGRAPPAGSAPGNAPTSPGRPTPPGGQPQNEATPMRVTVAVPLRTSDVTRGDCRSPYGCDTALSDGDWCNENSPRPLDCPPDGATSTDLVCPPREEPTRPPPTRRTGPDMPAGRPGERPIPDRGTNPEGPSRPGGGGRRPGERQRPDVYFPLPPTIGGGGENVAPPVPAVPGRRPGGEGGPAVNQDGGQCDCKCDCGNRPDYRFQAPPPAPNRPGASPPLPATNTNEARRRPPPSLPRPPAANNQRPSGMTMVERPPSPRRPPPPPKASEDEEGPQPPSSKRRRRDTSSKDDP